MGTVKNSKRDRREKGLRKEWEKKIKKSVLYLEKSLIYEINGGRTYKVMVLRKLVVHLEFSKSIFF